VFERLLKKIGKKYLKAFDKSLGGKFLKISRNIEKEIP